ncbi:MULTISPECIES: copper chaperone PCu(A)C [Stutzerimonas]|uniref:copper chaperone PCu(A)C n=1 Tax=Stutzerimonas TaxID=2901164 RepID=UPI00190E0C3A|nr:copper chaperone PCu(A)C [Stutzerimonas balearica]MBD3737761.1 copper chaperone PCu(A)C [Stutzerimonas balearica]MBK3748030.1 copper chaperone PCu(A)C [Stutzerimonas balearica]MBK3826227.1 copper chaperone PCu(A)C [Stutzerimonas balearica]MBK3855918.1 copper chaperone PCu(A)C [Stutzerimonas balearica]MBS4150484.1 copper chaperone PCu(A)C [Stutzerimonas balearica]
MLLRLLTAGALSAVCLAASAADESHAHAGHAMQGSITIAQPWSRAMPPSAPTGAVYFQLQNQGQTDDRLVGAQTPRAERAELHMHKHEGDVMRMVKVDEVKVPAGGSVAFAPGGYHVMLFGLKQPLVAGERFPVTLKFEHAGEQTVEVPIQENAPAGSAHSHH